MLGQLISLLTLQQLVFENLLSCLLQPQFQFDFLASKLLTAYLCSDFHCPRSFVTFRLKAKILFLMRMFHRLGERMTARRLLNTLQEHLQPELVIFHKRIVKLRVLSLILVFELKLYNDQATTITVVKSKLFGSDFN